MSFSYTALAMGLSGFKTSDGSYKPVINPTNFPGVAAPHNDISTTFPFLGAPHP